MKFYIPFAMFAVVFFGSHCNSDRAERARPFLEDTYHQAQVLYDSSANLFKALELFKYVGTNDSSACFWKSYLFMANIYLRWGLADSAMKTLERAEKRFSSWPDFYPKDYILENLHAFRTEIPTGTSADIEKAEKKSFYDLYGFIECDSPPEPIGGYAALLSNVKYPEDALQQQVTDTVIVKTLISWRGEVCKTEILKGGKLESLRKAARQAIHRTKWRPAKLRRYPATVWVIVPVRFNQIADSKKRLNR